MIAFLAAKRAPCKKYVWQRSNPREAGVPKENKNGAWINGAWTEIWDATNDVEPGCCGRIAGGHSSFICGASRKKQRKQRPGKRSGSGFGQRSSDYAE